MNKMRLLVVFMIFGLSVLVIAHDAKANAGQSDRAPANSSVDDNRNSVDLIRSDC
jgi:hypothetical protein